MNGKQLKNSILQWAIQGKLVPQDPNDEPASVLLERIRAEKARLVKEGKIKKDKNESIIYKGDDNSYYEKFPDGKVVCIDEEIPFEVPKGWEWTRLNSIAIDSADGPFGSNLKKEHYTNKREVRIIQLSNIGDNGWKDANTRYTTFKHLELIKRSEAFPNDIIIAKMMPAGRAILCPNHEQKYVLSSDAVRFNIPDIISHRYLYHAINSPVFIDQVCGEVQGITRVRTSLQKLRNYLLPIPPKSEQDRILSALDSIEQLILQYESCRLSLDSLNKTVQDKLKKSILQEAIQGKLVPQDPNDEPAEKLLEEINAEKQRLVKAEKLKAKDAISSVIFKGDDNKYYEKTGKDIVDITEEIPFEIPESWEWSRLKNVVLFNPKNVAPYDTIAAFMPMNYISPGYGSSFMYDEIKWGKIKKGFSHFADGDIAFAKITPCFQNRKSFIANNLPSKIGAGTTELIVLRPYGNTLCREFVLFFLQSSYFVEEAKFKGTAGQQRIMVGYSENKLFPVPPYEEQIRISSKINELLASIMSR